MSAATMLILLLVLIAFDSRVREQLSKPVVPNASVQLSSAEHRVRDVAIVIIGAAQEQSRQHAPLLIFTLASAVILLFMLRT
jgi:hypothetical protein